jgi:hypothetical protein
LETSKTRSHSSRRFLITCNKIGSLKAKFKNTMGKDADIFFEEVKYVPDLNFNLFSMTFGMRKGWKLNLLMNY